MYEQFVREPGPSGGWSRPAVTDTLVTAIEVEFHE
jgi:hypothetical protein